MNSELASMIAANPGDFAVNREEKLAKTIEVMNANIERKAQQAARAVADGFKADTQDRGYGRKNIRMGD